MFRTLALTALLATAGCGDSSPADGTAEPAAAEDAQPKMGGLGMKVGATDGRLYINSVREPGPAAEAGIVTGDELVSIDDVPLTGAPVAAVVTLAMGEAGSTSMVTVRGVDGSERTVAVTRWDVARLLE